jgi:hypothetical protein
MKDQTQGEKKEKDETPKPHFVLEIHDVTQSSKSEVENGKSSS